MSQPTPFDHNAPHDRSRNSANQFWTTVIAGACGGWSLLTCATTRNRLPSGGNTSHPGPSWRPVDEALKQRPCRPDVRRRSRDGYHRLHQKLRRPDHRLEEEQPIAARAPSRYSFRHSPRPATCLLRSEKASHTPRSGPTHSSRRPESAPSGDTTRGPPAPSALRRTAPVFSCRHRPPRTRGRCPVFAGSLPASP